ncbi:MAG TPA: hypothetical protein VIJ26_09535, partial [Thermoanaerobaculia bacterium]
MTRQRPALSGALALILAMLSLAARQLLLAGVTSARDLGTPLDDILAVREAVRKGKIPGPTLYVDLLSNVNVVVKHR